MEFRPITEYEASEYYMPVAYTPPEEKAQWYALQENYRCIAFMEVTEYDSISEITFLYVPDLYQGNGYGAYMIQEFIAHFLPEYNMLTASFEYSRNDGDRIADILSSNGFMIEFTELKEYSFTFEEAYDRFVTGKKYPYKGRMFNFAVGLDEVISKYDDYKDNDIALNLADIQNADLERSVAAISDEGKVEALLLVQRDIERGEARVNFLYTDTEDSSVLRAFFAFAFENAKYVLAPPTSISFVATNPRLEKMFDGLFNNPPTSTVVMADAEFSVDKYLKQIELTEMLRR